MSTVLTQWNELHAFANGTTTVETVGVRDPENPCDAFDARGYDGDGDCASDGHYLRTECSRLSPDAPRFHEHGARGRLDRIRARALTLRERGGKGAQST